MGSALPPENALADVAAFRAREERWDKIRAAGLPWDDPREDAPATSLLSDDGVSIEYRGSGGPHPRPGVPGCQPWPERPALTGHLLAFAEDGVLIAPWEVTELIVTAAERRDPAPILEYVAGEERQARYEAIHGQWSRGGRHSDGHHISAEICAQVDAECSRPCREVLRSWCGADAADRFDELAELRRAIRRVGEVAQAAISALWSVGGDAEASRLQRELVPEPSAALAQAARFAGHEPPRRPALPMVPGCRTATDAVHDGAPLSFLSPNPVLRSCARACPPA